MIGSVRCHRTRNLDVKRVYDNGMGMPISCSHMPIPSWKEEIFDSCATMSEVLIELYKQELPHSEVLC